MVGKTQELANLKSLVSAYSDRESKITLTVLPKSITGTNKNSMVGGRKYDKLAVAFILAELSTL